MKKIPIEEAIGQRLIHDLTAIMPGGFKGVRFRRNHLIGEEDLEILRDMGKNHIYVLDNCDNLVHEEDAAHALAEQILDSDTSHSIVAGKMQEGKISLLAKHDGLLKLNCEGLLKLNQVSDWTMPTLMDLLPVHESDIVATLRIIPLLTAQENVSTACKIVADFAPLLQILPYQQLRVGIILTGNEIYEGRIQDAFEPILRRKLNAFPATVVSVCKCPDQLDRLIATIVKLSANCDLLLLTGGMSVDPDDLTPTAIRSTADHFITQGVPIQPGNMLTLARREQTDHIVTMLGIPGASMHAPVTSLDIFLPRIFADLLPTAAEISSLAIGGLSSRNYNCWPTLPLSELQISFQQPSEKEIETK